MGYTFTLPRKVATSERRAAALTLLRETPGITYSQIATKLGVTVSTISRDFKEMSKEWELQNRNDFTAHQRRLLEDIQHKKNICMDKLKKCSQANQGARWMEEYSKLLGIECKLLSLFDKDKIIDQIKEDKVNLTKSAKDALIRSFFDDDIIPMKSANPKEVAPALPAPEEL